jgi:4-hydroxybenzoate polyprenyltransferase
MKLSTALRLGRISNLPTTWTNVAAGLALSGASLAAADANSGNAFLPIGVALCAIVSCMYVGGMFLNDAFDREYDARERPERPIPSGEVSAGKVFAIGFTLLAIGITGTAALAFLHPAGTGWPPVLAALALAAVIVFYDAYHKQNPLSPVVMAGNRVLVYVLAALMVQPVLTRHVLWGAGGLGCYLIGLTYAAKQENLRELRGLWPLALLFLPVIFPWPRPQNPPFEYEGAARSAAWIAFMLSTIGATHPLTSRTHRDIRKGVTRLIAGICLFDGLMVASQGHIVLFGLCYLGYLATLFLQRFVPGT